LVEDVACLVAIVDPSLGGRLLGAAEGLRAALGPARPIPAEPAWNRALAVADAGLDPAMFAELWQAGQRLSFAAAFDAAEAALISLATTLATREPRDAGGAGADEADPGLTRREREILRLLVEGHSNPQIADALSISRKTVSIHVSNILGKLGVASRAAAASYAVRHGLV
jgi:DNA-binding CsgD family transcriptional regulator